MPDWMRNEAPSPAVESCSAGIRFSLVSSWRTDVVVPRSATLPRAPPARSGSRCGVSHLVDFVVPLLADNLLKHFARALDEAVPSSVLQNPCGSIVSALAWVSCRAD